MTLLSFPTRSALSTKNHASQYACRTDQAAFGSAGTTTSVNQIIVAVESAKRIAPISRSLLQLGCHYPEQIP